MLSREGGGDGSGQAGERLSVKRTPAREGVVRDLSPPAGAARKNGCCLTHATNASGLPRDGLDFAGTLPLATPGGSHVPQAPVAAVQVQIPEAPSIFLSGSELIFPWQDTAGA